MSNRRRQFDDRRYVHFFTFSVYKRRRLLDLDQPKRIVLGVLNHQLRAMAGKCAGFVLMPEHIHALIWLPQPQDWRRFLHGWKRMSSFRIRQWYRASASNYFVVCGELISPKSHARKSGSNLIPSGRFFPIPPS